MLAESLKHETSDVHQKLEKTLIPSLKNIRQPGDYVKILKTFYGFYAAIEPQLDRYLDENIVPYYNSRRKASSLMDDIRTWTDDISVSICSDAPSITNADQAMGVLYVLEGSTLGGKIISVMIGKALGIEDDRGISFFYGYGADTDAMWASFKDALNNYATGTEQQRIVIDAASDTFSKFRLWIEHNLAMIPEK